MRLRMFLAQYLFGIEHELTFPDKEPASVFWKKLNSPLLKTLLIGSLFFSIVIILIPLGIFMATRDGWLVLDIGALRYAGLIPFILGALVSLCCVKDFVVRGKGTPAPFDPPSQLVVCGLYRYVRNPMYVGLFLVLIGEAALYFSVFVLFYSVLVISSAHAFVVFYEEPTLRRRFGDSYERYSRAVPRWLPRAKGNGL